MSTTSTLVYTKKNIKNIPLELDNSYKGDEIGQRCCEILSLPNIHGWSVVDYDKEEQLALLHYNEDSDKTLYGHIRGLFIDLESNAVIADSFGYTPIVVLPEIKAVDNSLIIQDNEGKVHTFSMKEAIIKRVFEGVVIRVIWRKGKMYRITHRKINTIKSRWGSSKSFISMYEEAGGPTAEQLFDITVPNSSTCYDFLVVDRSLLVATRQVVDSPYIVCISKREMVINRPLEEIAKGIATFETTEEIKGKACGPFIHDPQCLSIDEANTHLRYGYYNAFTPTDYRQATGEAIIIYKMADNKIVDSVKVHSPCYDWRTTIRDNNPNVYNAFFNLFHIINPPIKTEEEWNNFRKKLMIFPAYDEQQIRNLREKKGYIFALPVGTMTKEDFVNREDRRYLLWINYFMSLPMHLQESALDLLNIFNKDRSDVTEWISNLERNNKDLKNLEVSDRVKFIIISSRKLSKTKEKKPSSNTIAKVIRNLINKETGPSLYGLIRDMKRERKLKLKELDALVKITKIPGKTLVEIEGDEIEEIAKETIVEPLPKEATISDELPKETVVEEVNK